MRKTLVYRHNLIAAPFEFLPETWRHAASDPRIPVHGA
jgi:hypothetical protein